MVDIAEAENAKAKKKFSPKFDASPQKKAKTKKNAEFDKLMTKIKTEKKENSPGKKRKMDKDLEEGSLKKIKVEKDANDENSNPNRKVIKKEPGKKIDKKKKLKFDESVKGREFKPDGKKKLKVKDGVAAKKLGKIKDKKAKVELLNKKETREKQKKTKEIRKKFKQEDVFDIGVKAKKVWEEVRREDCPEDKKEKLVQELHSLVKGNIKKIIFAHDTVRVIECLMALGSSDIRDKLFEELKGDIIEMSKSKYAHFFVQKILKYGNKEQRALVLKEMEGKIARLMKNKTASNVVETMYNDIANGPQRNSMLQEFLDNEFMHFKEPELRNVPDIIAKYPNRKKDCVQNLQRNVEVMIRKGTFNHSLVHTVIYNYLLVAESKQRSDVIEQLRESLVHMAHSREGAYAALQCIWHGTAKDRKAIIKNFKTFMLKTAQEEYGHMVLLGIFDSVDDTKIVGKAVIGELLENLEELFKNKFGTRVLKYLFSGRDPTYVHKDMVAILEKGDGNEHSKKESGVRHKELVAVAAPALLNFIKEKIPDILYDAPTTITLTCIINSCPPSTELEKLFNSIAKQVAKPFAKGDDSPNLVENGGSSMMIRKILDKDKTRSEREEKTFSSVILSHLEEEGVESWIRCNRGCFLMVNMWDTTLPEIQQALKTKLKPFLKVLQKQETQGAKILREKIA